MNHLKYRPLGIASVCLTALVTAFACGGLDGRDITRGPDVSEPGAGGDPSSPGHEPKPGAGGNSDGDGVGGAVDQNPFGGDTFTGGAPPVVDGPPEVVDVLPKDGADDAEPTDIVALKFSEALDDNTVTADSVKVMDGDTQVGGKLSYSGVTATLKPSVRLSLLADYDIQATKDITDVEGQPLKAPFAAKFTVRDGVWGDQKTVFDDQTTWSGQQEVGTDANGNSFVVWSTRDPMSGVSTGCQARRYNVHSGWEAPITVSDPADNCYSMKLSVSPEGDAIVGWIGADYPNYIVRARRYFGGQWEAMVHDVDPTAATQMNGDSYDLAVSVAAGQGVVGWIRIENEGAPNYYSSYYLNLSYAGLGDDWPASPTNSYYVYSSAPNYDSIDSLSTMLDPQGNAIVTFNFNSASTDPTYGKGVYYARKAAKGNWQSPARIPSAQPSYGQAALVSDGDGAMVAWTIYDTATTAYYIMASRYTKTKQFTAPVPINDPDLKEYVTLTPRHALASDGRSFFATWMQTIGSSRNAYVSRYDIATSKWDALPTVVSDGVAVTQSTSAIGVDAHGNAIVVFDQQGAMSTLIMGARYTASNSKWSKPAAVTDDGLWYKAPLLTVGSNGVAALMFSAGHNLGHQVLGVLGGEYRIFD